MGSTPRAHGRSRARPRTTMSAVRALTADGRYGLLAGNSAEKRSSGFIMSTFVASMNPCSCGYYGDPVRECTCSMSTVSRYPRDSLESPAPPAPFRLLFQAAAPNKRAESLRKHPGSYLLNRSNRSPKPLSCSLRPPLPHLATRASKEPRLPKSQLCLSMHPSMIGSR